MRRPPTPYSAEIAEQILERIECGETLEAIAKTDGMPSRNTIRKWQRGAAEGVPEDFPARFEAALKVRLEGFVDDLLQLPRNADPNHPGELQIVKLECENRRWLLSKLLREQFGDRAAIDVGGQRDNPLQQSEAHRRWLEEIMTAEEKENSEDHTQDPSAGSLAAAGDSRKADSSTHAKQCKISVCRDMPVRPRKAGRALDRRPDRVAGRGRGSTTRCLHC